MKTASRIAVAAAASLVMIAGPASAHARLIKSDPAANATVHAGPKAITLTFDDPLVDGFSKFTLSMPGMTMPVKTSVSADRKSIVGKLPSALPKGDYKVAWTAASTDGHKTTGTLSFKVG